MPVIITSRVDGFRRAGMAHPARPVEYPDDRFSPEQLAALRNEPMLEVAEAVDSPISEPQSQDAEGAKKPAKKKGRK